ncbi:hypothetical protein [Anaerorhabdus sp.]|uniref:hypothetical protein n=1 Tax=Anaerorhabdus sp. TaxID=1872524 RepID=UPI002FC8E352
MKELSIIDAEKQGIKMKNHMMDNGEKRFRLVQDCGSSYICTITAEASGWQNSHYHLEKKEFYLLESGCAYVAELIHQQLQITQLKLDEVYSIKKGNPHNIYLDENSVLHTIKYGTKSEDWHACIELDEMVKIICVKDIK